MNKDDVLHQAGRIAEAMVIIHNTVNGPAMATWQPENGRVEFYLYGMDGERTHHFRFAAEREFTISDMRMGTSGYGQVLYRANMPDRALAQWALHIHGYIL